jgi:translation elongation factor EF-1alpha
MDDRTVNYSLDRYEEIVQETEKATRISILGSVVYIPISAYKGYNLAEKSSEISWYRVKSKYLINCNRYKGPTLLEAIDNVCKVRKADSPLLATVNQVNKHNCCEVFIVSGTINEGQSVSFSPLGSVVQVKSIKNRSYTNCAGISKS